MKQLEDRLQRLERGKNEDALEEIKKRRAMPQYRRAVAFIRSLRPQEKATFRRELLDKLLGR